jgi:hypothetical protein
MASTNQQIIANLYQVFTTDTVGNIANINIGNTTTGNLTANGNVNLGVVSNVHITGGTPGQILATDGTGNLSFVTISAATGNIAGLNLNGNGQQVLAGNGAWVPQAASANYGNIVNTNYSGNGQQVLAGNGVWVANPQGNIQNTNYSGNAQQFLNGAGIWTGIPGINVGNVAYANFTGNPNQALTGTNTWTAISNVAGATFNGNPNQVLTGANTWINVPALTVGNVAYANFTGNSLQVLTGANTWVPMSSGNVGNVGTVAYANFTGNSGQVLTGANTWTTITGSVVYPTPANNQVFLNGAGGWSVPSGGGSGITYPGNIQQWLRGDGAWANIDIPTYGNVAYANFNGNPNSYLTGSNTWITTAELKTSLALGNIANTSYNGNPTSYLRGDGAWAPITIPVVGNVAYANFNGNGNTYLAGDGLWRTIASAGGNIGNVNLNGNTFTYLNGAGQWANISVPVVGNVASLNLNGNIQTVLSGTGTWIPASTGGNVSLLNLNGNPNTVLSGTGSWRALGNVSASNYNGNANTYLNGAGQWITVSPPVSAAGSNSWVQFNTGGNFNANSQFTYDIPNSTMRSTKVSTDTLRNIKNATENILLISAPLGSYNFDMLTSSVQWAIDPAPSNLVLNIRGNATTSFYDATKSHGGVTTVTYMMQTATPGYIVSQITIDGVGFAVLWSGGVIPTNRLNTTTVYAITIINTTVNPASPVYRVLASFTEYR